MKRKSVDVFRSGLRDGDELLCVENTLRPVLNGTRRTLKRVGVTAADCVMDGKPFRMPWPTRVSDVLAVSETEITYRIGRDEHTVTLRRI